MIPVRDLRQWENGGYFVLRPEIFDYFGKVRTSWGDAVPRLVQQGKAMAYPHKGYWIAGRTVKERAQLGGDVPPGRLPVDDVGPRALGGAAARVSRRR